MILILTFSRNHGFRGPSATEGRFTPIPIWYYSFTSTGNILYITEERLDVVDFLPSMVQISLLFVFREPPLSYQNNLYLLPFKSTIWYCTAGFAIIFIFILYIIGKWEKKKIQYETDQKVRDWTYLYFYSSMRYRAWQCLQGLYRSVSSFVARCRG